MIFLDTLRRPGHLAGLLAVLVALAAPAAFAAGNGAALSSDQIVQKVLAQGYAKVIRMEMEDGIYEVKAKTRDGKRVNLNVDPKSGKVLGKHKDGLFSN